jgi:hypothetical protein
MHTLVQNHNLLEQLSLVYNALYFVWPPILVYLLRNRRRLMSRLITLWTVSGVISVALVLTNLSAVSLLPQFVSEPHNTIIIVSLRLATLVFLATLMVRPADTVQAER